MVIPLFLKVVNGSDVLLEAVKCAALPDDSQVGSAVFAMFVVEEEVGEAPPMDVVEIEVFVEVGPAFAGDNGLERYDRGALDVRINVTCEVHIPKPPDWVGMSIDSAGDKSSVGDKAGTEILGDTLVNPSGSVQVGQLIVELMDGFMDHPVIGVDFTRRVVGITVRGSVKGLGPANKAVAAAELVSIFEEFEL
jgi:hypothetical protein